MNGNKPVILITGGLGNLGAWMTDHFVSKNEYDVYVLTKNDRDILVDHSFRKIFCDITDIDSLKRNLACLAPDYVIHLASINETFSENYALSSLLVNSYGTRNLLECVSNWTVKKFVYISTFHVYGKEQGVISEQDIPTPVNDYGITHLFAEMYVNMFSLKHKIPSVVLRLSNSYGCPKDHNSSKWYLLFNDLCRQAIINKSIQLKTNGTAVRDFLCMKDVCAATEAVMLLPDDAIEIFNLGSGQVFSLLQMAEYIKEAFFEEYGEVVPVVTNEQDTHQYSTFFNYKTDKLKDRITFSPTVCFKEEAKKIFKLLKLK